MHDAAGRLLLVRRGTEPGRGRWSVPGGRVEAGESGEDAVVREVAEETGLAVVVLREVGRVERDGPGGVVYAITDHLAALAPGADAATARAGDDADEVGWFAPDDLDDLDCVPGLVEALRSWRVIPPGRPPR